MIICVCSNINETNLRNLIKYNKIKSVREFHNLQLCCNCAKCYKEVQDIIREENEQDIYENC
jgi:bacterioferritin-associated ferredoxin